MSTDMLPIQSNRTASSGLRHKYGPGDFVTTVTGYPVLYEVLSIEADGLLRVRGVNWASGYSAVVRAQEVRPVTSLLSR